MAGPSLIRALFALCGVVSCQGWTSEAPHPGTDFTSSPGLQRVTLNNSATLTWRVDYLLDGGERAYLRRYPQGLLVVDIHNSAISQYGSGYGPSKISLYLQQGGTGITFTLYDVTPDDAGGYSYDHRFPSHGFKEDNNATLFVYDYPTKPVITGDYVVIEGDSVTLTCSAASTSLPAEFRHPVWYSWTRNGDWLPNDGRHHIQGAYNSQLYITNANATDHRAIYTCTAHEEDSVLEASTDERLIVLFWETTPGRICEIDGRGVCLVWIFGDVYSQIIDSIFWRYKGPSGTDSPKTALIYDGDTDQETQLEPYDGRVYYQRGNRSATMCFTHTIYEHDYGWFEVDVTTGGFVIPRSMGRLNIFCCECSFNETMTNGVRRYRGL